MTGVRHAARFAASRAARRPSSVVVRRGGRGLLNLGLLAVAVFGWLLPATGTTGAAPAIPARA